MDAPLPVDLSRVAGELGLAHEQVVNVTALLDDGNTVPFITRYRKEKTGNLDEEQIRGIQERVRALRQLSERAHTILRLIEAQDRLTPELRSEIEKAATLKRLEDLYLPYRPKRRSRGTIARERGLAPLAEGIWRQSAETADLMSAAQRYVDPARELPAVSDVLQGAGDILAEQFADDAELRAVMRRVAWDTGLLSVAATKSGGESGKAYQDYFDYNEAVSKIPPHRALALNRGEKESALRIRFAWDDDLANASAARQLGLEQHRHREFVERCAADALQRLIQPSLEREIRRELTDRAEEHAVSVFARNLRNLLLQPPLRGQRVVALDPGFRSGCKLAALDETGKHLATEVIFATGSAEKREATRARLAEFARQYQAGIFAIGNGTACREAEQLVAETIAEHLPTLRYVIVNEAGASIYSTSHVAREEFPEFDATARGTISIGRRLQDPLSELVKIDPQHIGVGMYQHDLTAKRLKESLDQVIESCVNYVGVDLNTASASLLRHVSGLNQLIARRVVEWRDQHGRFQNRQQLREVAGVGDATFTQAAGFLKINGGDEPLDGTWIHPESYETTRKLLERCHVSLDELGGRSESANSLQKRLAEIDRPALAEELQVGLPTLNDILEALAKPGRDPRSELPGPVFRTDILKLEDLSEGMELTGTVLNVVDFGAFVDVGLKDSGMVHISKLANRYIKTPHDVVAVGDVVKVWVLGIDRERRRVSLTMVPPGTEREPGRTHENSANRAAAAPRRQRTAEVTAAPKAPAAKAGGAAAPAPAASSNAPPKKPKPSPRALPVDGGQPLRGFDELKELWKNRNE